MAKQAKQKSSKVVSSANEVTWPAKCKLWLKQLVGTIDTQRDNSYKLIALIMLGKYGSLKDGEFVNLVDGKHLGWFGKSSNSISETTKKMLDKFLVDGGYPNFDRSYYSKIWSDIIAQARLPRFEKDKLFNGAMNGTIHSTLDARKVIAAIENGQIVISIKQENFEKVKGTGKNGMDKSKWYKRNKDTGEIKSDAKGNPIATTKPKPTMPTNPTQCRSVKQIEHALKYWKGIKKNAGEKITALQKKQ